MRFLESESLTKSLDGPAFAQVNESAMNADYLLGGRRIVAALKTSNGDPQDATEKRLRERFQAPGAPIVLGQVSAGQAISSLAACRSAGHRTAPAAAEDRGRAPDP